MLSATSDVRPRSQAVSGLGLDAQRAAIATECDRRGWDVEWAEDAGHSGRSLARPGILSALSALESGDADVLMVSKLDRLSRSVKDFASLLDLSRKQHWSLVALDVDVDTTTATGELTAGVMMQIAQWERRVIGERTTVGLAAAKARGTRLGRPVRVDDEVADRIA